MTIHVNLSELLTSVRSHITNTGMPVETMDDPLRRTLGYNLGI